MPLPLEYMRPIVAVFWGFLVGEELKDEEREQRPSLSCKRCQCVHAWEGGLTTRVSHVRFGQLSSAIAEKFRTWQSGWRVRSGCRWGETRHVSDPVCLTSRTSK